MTNKEFVLTKHPKAYLEKWRNGKYCVRKDPYGVVLASNKRTENGAWHSARTLIENKEKSTAINHIKPPTLSINIHEENDPHNHFSK